MWRLCCPYLYLISPSFGVSGGLCVVIVVFPGYLHLYFDISWKLSLSCQSIVSS